MINDAELHAADDKRRREGAETRNEADSTLYQARRQLDDDTDDGSNERSALEAAVDQLAAAIEAENPEAMKRTTEDARTAAQAYAQFRSEHA